MSIERIDIKSRGQWLSLRQQDITASEIAVLFGLHPYRTLLQTYMSKTPRGEGDEGDNPSMRRGRILEPGTAVAMAELEPDWRLEKANCYVRDTVARIGATPDYFIHGDPRGAFGILECKSAAPEIFESQWQSGPPQYCILQCLTQMMLTDAAFGVVACLVDNRAKEVFPYPVERHPKAEDLIRHKAAQFWATVEAGQIPQPDYRRDAEMITAMFPRDNGNAINLGGDNRLPALLDEREMLRASLSVNKEQLDAIEAEIKHKIGEHTEAYLPGWKLTHKLQSRKEYTVAATAFRVLRVTKLAKEAA
jgi:putative phage-type endonuclease